MQFFSIKSKVLLAFVVFLVIITLLNAGLTAYVINRRSEAEAFAQLSRQLRLFQIDLQGLRETLFAVAQEAARDEKNLSDLAILYNQALKLRQESGAALDNTFSLNKMTSLNRLQLILLSARLSSAALYLKGELSHYVTQDEAGMIVQRGGQEAVISTRQKEHGKVLLTNWRNWPENSLPGIIARHTPVIDRMTISFDFSTAHMLALRVVVPIQGITRASFNETIAEELTIAAPETLLLPGAGGKRPEVIGMFVFSSVFDAAFLKEIAAKTGLFPAIFSPDGQHSLKLLDPGRTPAELLTAQGDLPIQSKMVKIGQTSYYQAFMPWRIDSKPALILGFALSREGVLATIKQTVIGIITAAGLILVIGGALGYLLIVRLMMPITSLTAAVSAMEIDDADSVGSAKQDKTSHAPLGYYLEHPITPQSGDEIGELTRAFNALAAQLHQSFATLEERVHSRTRELAIAKEHAEEAQRAAEAASQAKSDFLSNMSHELRTPLNGILGYAHLLKQQPNLTPAQKSQIDIIQSSGKHLLTMINEILDLGKIEAHKMDVASGEFELPAVLHHVYNLAKVQADAKALRVSYEERSPLPAVVRGDERKLTQILLNLVGNAVKYTEHGQVKLIVSHAAPQRSDKQCAADAASDAERLCVEIEDTGVGIAPDQLEAIFDPFTQVGETWKTTEGAGLGLTITRKLVELLHGALTVTSAVGQGSTFRVELPLPAVEDRTAAARRPKTRIIGYQGERRRILIGDDNRANLAMLASLLEPLGFALTTAYNGEEVVQRALDSSPDLILLDYLMPEMDGLDALQELRTYPALQRTPIIGVSATVGDRSHAHAFVSACDDFLPKPVDLDLLLDKIQAHLRLTWEFAVREIPESPAGVNGETAQIPPATTLDVLRRHLERGDFRKIEHLLRDLECTDPGYTRFCQNIQPYMEHYDSQGILRYLQTIREVSS